MTDGKATLLDEMMLASERAAKILTDVQARLWASAQEGRATFERLSHRGVPEVTQEVDTEIAESFERVPVYPNATILGKLNTTGSGSLSHHIEGLEELTRAVDRLASAVEQASKDARLAALYRY